MKLYAAKIPIIAGNIVSTLTADGDIETAEPREVEADLESVLKEYLRLDRELTERAKDRAEASGKGKEDIGRIKRLLAEQKGFGLGDEGINWMLDQLVAMLLRSNNVDEVFAEDAAMRRKMRTILQKHTAVDDELDREARARIKNLTEGTSEWEVEMARVREQLKRSKGIG